MNVHKKNFCGAGMALFYNSILLTMCVAAMIFVITFAVYRNTLLEQVFLEGRQEANEWKPDVGFPVVIQTYLHGCTNSMQNHIIRHIQDFARKNFAAITM